ncbi:tol-pal system-associated acyl-CoA thioesterase [uncultured Abyssibacter sp.]|mgnify:CR=1 FL=1|uniref:tol-pal system-associated acyl-CoA thioesterase n=1 Tax=uncultured Abyssibacter sp. TaxID=2320202 RepID=UPI0032B22167
MPNLDEISTFWWTTRVYYEDTDASGVVYHANYLRYLERARTEWVRHLGWSQERLRSELDLCFAVSEMTMKFLGPARLDDEVAISVQVAECKRASIRFHQAIHVGSSDGRGLIQAQVRVACLTESTFKPRALPAEFFGSNA